MSRITNPTSESSVTCGFFNGTMDRRRTYDAHQLSSLFDGILKDGVFASIGECFRVEINTDIPNTVNVLPGKAWFNKTWTLNDSILPIDCGTSSTGLDRIDAIVIEVNKGEEVLDNFIKFIPGTPSSTPVKPSLIKTNDVYQYALCYITRIAGSDAITAADIEYVVGTGETPFVTGIMETVSVDSLFTQWEGEFDSWFAHIQDTLSDDVAGKLAVDIDDVRVKALGKNARFELAAEYKIAGAYTWTPSENERLVMFVIVGAGEGGSSGSGGSASYRGGSGGMGGEVVISELLSITPNEPINIVIGKGGAGGISQYVTENAPGEAGGASSCMGITANGGNYGVVDFDYDQYSAGRIDIEIEHGDSDYHIYLDINTLATSIPTSLGKVYFSGMPGLFSVVNGGCKGLTSHARIPVEPFGVLSAGGGAGGYFNGTATDGGERRIGADGTDTTLGKSGAGATAVNDTTPVSGGDGANGCGGGGGSGARGATKTSHIGSGGRGGDGYVAIYVLKGDVE